APQQSMIISFRGMGRDQRPLIYVLNNTTEAIAFQLDPARTLTWLAANAIIPPPALLDASPLEIWAAIHRAAPGLLQTRVQPESGAPAAIAARTLLHTVAHALLRQIAWSGYDPESVGEYLFPETLACVLYANRYHETKIGGLVTLFERGLD